MIVAWSDRFAYINHDIDDAVRGGVIKESDIPKKFISAFGANNGRRINSMIMDIIRNSDNKDTVRPGPEFEKLIGELREYMFENVYRSPVAKGEEQKAVDMIKFLFTYFLSHKDKLPRKLLDMDSTDEQKVCDYISMMSDNFAVRMFEEICIPKSWAIL